MSPDEPARRRDANRTRAALLDAAERVFVRDGWARATLAAIGAEAGVSRGTPAYFFASKGGLRAAMTERLVSEARVAGEDTGGHPRDRARVLLARQLDLVARRPALAALALAHWSGSGGDTTSFAALEAQLIRRLADLLEAIPGRNRAAEPQGVAAMLLCAVWSSGLRRAPGSVAGGPAALADRQAVLAQVVANVFNDMSLDDVQKDATQPLQSSLLSSKSKRWRLPGVG